MNRCGIDIVEIARIAHLRHKDDFIERIFSSRERDIALLRGNRDEFFAGRWAAKEAVAKALGCGFGKDCSPVEIEILTDEWNAPQIFLSGAAAQRAGFLGITAWCVSISHEKNYAAAMVVAEVNRVVTQGEKDV